MNLSIQRVVRFSAQYPLLLAVLLALSGILGCGQSSPSDVLNPDDLSADVAADSVFDAPPFDLPDEPDGDDLDDGATADDGDTPQNLEIVRFSGPASVPPGSIVPVVVGVDDVSFFGRMAITADGQRLQPMVVRGRGSIPFQAPAAPGQVRFAVVQAGYSGEFVLNVEERSVVDVSGTLSGDQLDWNDDEDVVVSADVTVPSGSTLRIGAGTRIRLVENAQIRVEGELEVSGSASSPVLFLPDVESGGHGWGEINVKGAARIENAWFVGGGADATRAFGHSDSQPVIRVAAGASVNMSGGGVTDCPGKAFASQSATVILQGLLITRVDQGGEHKASKVQVTHSHFMHIPDDDGRADDDDNDGIYLSDTEGVGPSCLVQDCVFFQGEDDAIDHNGASVVIDRTWIRQFAHEGIAASKGRDVIVVDSVIMNCDQGIEAGYEGPQVFVNNCLLTGNGVGLRWGDSYEWPSTGTLTVRNTVSVGNSRHNVYFNDDQQGAPPEGSATVMCSMVDDAVFNGKDGNLEGMPLWNGSGCVTDSYRDRPEGCGPLGPQVCDSPPPVFSVSVTIPESDWKSMHDNPQTEKEFKAGLKVGGVRFSDVIMQVHGGFARTVPKLSFRFEIPDAQAVELDLFGDGPQKQRRFVLKAGWIDGTWIREYIALDLIRRVGGLAPRVSFVELFVNEEWQGLYLLVERIDKIYLKSQGLASEDVCLLKAENHQANWKQKDNPMDGYDLQQGTDDCSSAIDALLRACSLTPTNAAAFDVDVWPVLSMDDFMAFEYVRIFCGDRDAFTKNYYLHFAPEGGGWSKARVINWDGDAVFGNNWDGVPIAADDAAWYGRDSFVPRMIAVPEMRAAYLGRFATSLRTAFLPVILKNRVTRVAEVIRPVAIRDLLQWDRGMDFQAELDRLMDAIELRWQTMNGVVSFQQR